MAKYTVHAGHAPAGKLGHGAVGHCDESTVARSIKNSVISYLKADGNIVVDCTYDKAGTQSAIISAIKKAINKEQNVTANFSIHLNANKKVSKDGKVKGAECWIYPGDIKATNTGNLIISNLKKLGFTSRGVKTSTSLGVLKGIKNGGYNILIEVFFCDDADDFDLYSRVGIAAIGKAIAEAIVGHPIGVPSTNQSTNYIYKDKTFGEVDMSPVFNPDFYGTTYPDVKRHAVYGKSNTTLFEHFLIYGMKEARQGSKEFNVNVYKERYTDLVNAFGKDLPKYYLHYCKFGKTEGRKGI